MSSQNHFETQFLRSFPPGVTPYKHFSLFSFSCVVCGMQTEMPGMKRDCGGAAAILGAFFTAVKLVRLSEQHH